MQNMPSDHVLNRRKFLFDSGRLLVMISSFSALACACVNEKEGESRLGELVIEQGRIVLDLGESRYQALNTIGNGLKIEITRQKKPLIITRVSETRGRGLFLAMHPCRLRNSAAGTGDTGLLKRARRSL